MQPPVCGRGIPYYLHDYTAERVRPGDRGTREVGSRRREIKKGKAWCCRGSGTSPCVAVLLMRAGRRLAAAISLPPPPASALCSCAPAVNRALAAVNRALAAVNGGAVRAALGRPRSSCKPAGAAACWRACTLSSWNRAASTRGSGLMGGARGGSPPRPPSGLVGSAPGRPTGGALSTRRPAGIAPARWVGGGEHERGSPSRPSAALVGSAPGRAADGCPGPGDPPASRGLCVRGCWLAGHGRMVDGVPPAPLLTLADGL